MEKRDIQDSPVWDTLLRIVLAFGGMCAGIALCKLCPPFWYWLNSAQATGIPIGMAAMGLLCIVAGLCVRDVE